MTRILGQIFILVFLSCTQTSMTYTQDDILKDLDNNGGMNTPYKILPILDDAYTNVSSNKIYLFADKNRWAIVFATNGYNNRGYCIRKDLSYFGNCLENLGKAGLNGIYTSNTKYFTLCSEEELNKIKGDFEAVSENAKFIKIRDNEFPIEHDTSVYKLNNIPWHKYEDNKKAIDFPSVTRMLNFKYPEVFNATEQELRTCLPKDLPILMTINEWYYTDCTKVRGFEDRSLSVFDNETYKIIADILVSKDITKYKPTKKPNSDWRNWKSGNL